jgi:hypothetical protein
MDGGHTLASGEAEMAPIGVDVNEDADALENGRDSHEAPAEKLKALGIAFTDGIAAANGPRRNLCDSRKKTRCIIFNM